MDSSSIGDRDGDEGGFPTVLKEEDDSAVEEPHVRLTSHLGRVEGRKRAWLA